METAEKTYDISEQLNEKYGIPIETIGQANAIASYLNGLNVMVNDTPFADSIKAIKAVNEQSMWHTFKIETNFQRWSLVDVLGKSFRIDAVCRMLRPTVDHALATSDCDLLTKSLGEITQYVPYVITVSDLYEKIIALALRKKDEQILYALRPLMQKENTINDSISKSAGLDAVAHAHIEINFQNNNILNLIHALNASNEMVHYKTNMLIYKKVNDILKTQENEELAKMASGNSVDKEHELLIILSVLLLMKRMKNN